VSTIPLLAFFYLQGTSFRSSFGTGEIVIISSICGLIYFVLTITGLWKTFNKAGQPGWVSLIPIVRTYYVLKISGHPGWWLLLFFVPILNIVIWVMVALDLAYAFRQTTVFGVLVFFFPWLMYLVLGFGQAEYDGPHPV